MTIETPMIIAKVGLTAKVSKKSHSSSSVFFTRYIYLSL